MDDELNQDFEPVYRDRAEALAIQTAHQKALLADQEARRAARAAENAKQIDVGDAPEDPVQADAFSEVLEEPIPYIDAELELPSMADLAAMHEDTAAEHELAAVLTVEEDVFELIEERVAAALALISGTLEPSEVERVTGLCREYRDVLQMMAMTREDRGRILAGIRDVLQPKLMFKAFYESLGLKESTVYRQISVWDGTRKAPTPILGVAQSGAVSTGHLGKKKTDLPLEYVFDGVVHKLASTARRMLREVPEEQRRNAWDAAYSEYVNKPESKNPPAIVDQKLRQAPEAA